MNACACIGPAGDCPCVRQMRGERIEIKETYVSPEAWDYLTDEEKTTINELKLDAALRMIFAKRATNAPDTSCEQA